MTEQPMKLSARDAAELLKKEVQTLPDILTKGVGDIHNFGYDLTGLIEYWSSKTFRVLIFRHTDGTERISVHRMVIDDKKGTWTDNITWDELQNVKNQCGRGDRLAVEVFPKDENIINQSNIRHLWIVEDESYIWAKKKLTMSVSADNNPKDILRFTGWI
jgi:hypothetical protein